MKNYLLYFAMFLIVLCLPIRGSETEVRWLWAEQTWIPFLLLIASLMCVAVYLFKKGAMRKP